MVPVPLMVMGPIRPGTDGLEDMPLMFIVPSLLSVECVLITASKTRRLMSPHYD